MALAPLGFTVDTSPVARAVGDLGKLTAATAKADTATKKISTGTNEAVASVRQLGTASAVAATQFTAATNAMRASTAAMTVSTAQTRLAQQQARNLAFQFQDIGTMLAMGQSPFMLLAQQLPQVTMHGGRLTGVMGALKSSLAGIFSPLGLLTTGFVLAGSAAISYFSSASDEADIAAEALAEQEDLIRRVADQWGDAIPAIREYADEIDRVKQETELSTAVQDLANRAWEGAREILPGLRSEIGGVVRELIRANQTDTAINSLRDAFNAADRAAQDLRGAIADGTAEAGDFQRVTGALASLMANEGAQGADTLQQMVAELRDRYGEAADEAIRLAEAQASALAGGPIGGQSRIAAGKSGRSGGPSTLREDEFAGRFGWDDYFNFPREPSDRSRKAAISEAERERQAVRDLIADLEHEQSLIGSTSVEKARANALRQAGAAATEAERERIVELIDTTHAQREAIELQEQAYKALERAGETAMNGLVTAMADGKITANEFLSILINVAQQLLTMKNITGGGSGGGILGAIFSGIGSIFGGGASVDPWAGMRLASGGYVSGPGSGTSDSIRANLSNGEFVTNAAATARYRPTLEAINQNRPLPANDSQPIQFIHAPVYHVAQGADPRAIAELKKAQAQDRADFEGRVAAAVSKGRMRRQIR